MKILQVLNHFLPQQTAGTEVYTWALSKQLQQRGVNVQVLIPHYKKLTASDYVYDGLVVHQYAEPSIVDRSLIMGFRPPDGLPYFISYLQEAKPDLVHFHELAGSNGITLQHVQAAKVSGAKVIMTFHLAGYSCKTGTLVYKGESLCDGVIDLQKCSTCYLNARGYASAAPYLIGASGVLHQFNIDASKWNSKIGTALGTVPIIARLKTDLYATVAACDRVVTITNWYKRVLLANGIDERKISFIPQGLPLSTTAKPLKIKSAHQPLRLLFLGRINKFKGLHLLLEVLMAIDPALVELSVYGNSDDEAYEQALRTSTAQQPNIYWKGKLQQADVITIMQAHDVLCLCSTFSEMSPLVIQEAFAAGIPVIASKVYGNAEQIIHGVNGLLFNYNEVEDLMRQIVKCINEPDLVKQMSKNITEPRSFETVADDYFELYKNILS
jgi:glycosyltransferase involved in cell wall biosynthesis